MKTPMIIGLPLALASLLAFPSVSASPRSMGGGTSAGLEEIPDSELGAMRGRYTIGGQSIAWFGVTLQSTWQTASGQQLAGGLQIAMDLRDGNRPVLRFVPTMSIAGSEGETAVVGATGRHIDDAGLGNAGGLVQSIQLAGDGNAVSNRAMLVLRNAGPEDNPDIPDGQARPVMDGTARVQVGQQGQRTGVWLELPGQGRVGQWIAPGQMTQRVALTSDGSQVSNLLQMEVVRHPGKVEVPLALNVAQALGMTRGLAGNGP